MYRYTRIIIILLAAYTSAAAPPCVPLHNNESLKASTRSNQSVCFLIAVKDGEPTELAIDQPADLELRLTGNGTEMIIDGFEFGSETATIVAPGQYQVEIRPVSRDRTASITFVMSRRPESLQSSSLRRAAEEGATKAKHTGSRADLQTALDLWTKAGDASAAGRTWIEIGETEVGKADLSESRRSFEKALALCKPVGDIPCEGGAENDRGWLAQQIGDLEQALSSLTRAADDWHRSGEPKLEGQTFSNLGLLFWQTGDYQQAIGYYDRAGALLRPRDRLANARVLNNLGLCYQSLIEHQQAIVYFEQALHEFVEQKSPRDAVRARLNVGRTYMLQGNLKIARGILDTALADANAIPDQLAQADVLDNLGQLRLSNGTASEARTKLDQALTLHRALGDRRMEAYDLYYLGSAANALGDNTAARDNFKKAIEIRQECGLRDASTDSLFALARLEQTAGNADAARELAIRALRIMESVRSQVPGPELRASFYARQRRFFDLLVDLDIADDNSHSAADSLLAAEQGRGRALMDLLAEGKIARPVPSELLTRRASVQRKLDLLAVRLSSPAPSHPADLREQVENLVSEDEEIEARIRQSLTEQKLAQPLTSIGELQTWLPPESALLEFYLSEKQSYLWLVQAGGLRVFRLPSRAAIEAQCAPVLKLFPAILQRRRSPALQQKLERALKGLSATLLGPLAQTQLPARLILVPDGVLTRVPFAALDLSPHRRLGLTHDLVQVPSAAYLGVGRRPRNVADFPKALFAVADPVYAPDDPRVPIQFRSQPVGATLARLPFSTELDTVAALAPPNRLTIWKGFEASAAPVEKAPLLDYAVLHFSAHAIVDDRIPELSRIALSTVTPTGRPIDGFLRPWQLSQLHLNGSTVVLSACETALGKQVVGEGLDGFTTSLFSAGAAQLVLTLSPVDSEASSEFLSETYRNVFRSRPMAFEHAITLARQTMAASTRWSDPYYWASYVVYGRPFEKVDRRK
jgi:CHAT domain-containing protein/Tfp pilus assembly protein PilF